jgi:cytochrome c553
MGAAAFSFDLRATGRAHERDNGAQRISCMLRFAVLAALLTCVTAVWADTIEEKAALCGGCHGVNGVPGDPTTPIIWGQNAGYLYLQFRDFQKGARKDDRMTPIAQGLVKEDALALAEYFAAKPWPNTGAPAASKADTDVAIATNKSVVCTSCHLEQFQGDSSVPRLAGQEHDYLLRTIMDFRNHTRGNNPGMSDLMNTATPEQLAAMANYLAGM